MTAAERPSALIVQATGDTVGNNGDVEIRHNRDGSTTLRVANYREAATIFLTGTQRVMLAAALLGPSQPTQSDHAGQVPS